MSIKEKIIYIFISVITIGIYPIIINRNKTHKIDNKLSEAKVVSMDPNELIKNLGGKKNFETVEHTHTKIKIFIYNSSLVNVELLSKLKGVSGIFCSSKSIVLIVGNQAKILSEILKK